MSDNPELVREVEPIDWELAREWIRDSSDPEIRGVSVAQARTDISREPGGGGPRPGFPWDVTIAALNLVRDEPLESAIRGAILDAVAAVPGVVQIIEGSRETYKISGNPNGVDLANAVAAVVDRFATRVRDYDRDTYR
jgi:hypothetical protein